MNREEFIDLVWRLEEIMVPRDHLNKQIGDCGGHCEGYDGEEDEGLCPTCCEFFMKVQKEDERLAGDKEFNEVVEKLKQACDEDKTGEYQRILEQSREGKVIH